MSSVNPQRQSFSRSISTQPTANRPSAEASTKIAPDPFLAGPRPFHRHPPSISSMDPSRTPFNALTPLPAQVTPENFRLTAMDTESGPQYSTRVPRPGRRYSSFRSSLDLNRDSSESPTPSTSNDRTPRSQSAGPTLKYVPTVSSAAPNFLQNPREVALTNSHPSDGLYSTLQPRAIGQSYSGDTLVDESVSSLSRGSNVFTPDSVRSRASRERMGQTVDVHRYEPIKHYHLVLEPSSKNVLKNVAHPSVPIAQWPETAQGIILFIDFMDEGVKHALPFFTSSVLALTKGLSEIRNPPYSEGQAPAILSNCRLITRHHSPNTLATWSIPRRGVTTQTSTTRATVRGNAQSSWLRPENSRRMQRNGNPGAIRRSDPGCGGISRPIKRWIEQTAQHTPTGRDNYFWQQIDPVMWPRVVPEPSYRRGVLEPLYRSGVPEPSHEREIMPSVGRGGFQTPPNSGRRPRSPASFIHQPLPTYMPISGRPDMRRQASLGYLPGAVQELEREANLVSLGLGSAPHATILARGTIHAFRAYQRARGGSGGYARRELGMASGDWRLCQ